MPTYSEPIKEVISRVLVLHEELQVFEHLERRKGWSWSETEHTAPRHLPHLHLPPHPDTLICIHRACILPQHQPAQLQGLPLRPQTLVPQTVLPIPAIPGTPLSPQTALTSSHRQNEKQWGHFQALIPTQSPEDAPSSRRQDFSHSSRAKTTLKPLPQSFYPLLQARVNTCVSSSHNTLASPACAVTVGLKHTFQTWIWDHHQVNQNPFAPHWPRSPASPLTLCCSSGWSLSPGSQTPPRSPARPAWGAA